jgi:hypothetical protein
VILLLHDIQEFEEDNFYLQKKSQPNRGGGGGNRKRKKRSDYAANASESALDIIQKNVAKLI